MQSYRVPIILLFHYSGKNFHYSWFFVIFAGNEREMTHTDFDGIILLIHCRNLMPYDMQEE